MVWVLYYYHRYFWFCVIYLQVSLSCDLLNFAVYCHSLSFWFSFRLGLPFWYLDGRTYVYMLARLVGPFSHSVLPKLCLLLVCPCLSGTKSLRWCSGLFLDCCTIAPLLGIPSRTVCLGSTKCLTLLQLFYPRNVPKRVIGLSSGIKILGCMPTHVNIFVFSRFFDQNNCNKV